jgi:rubrerythrin
MDRQVLLDKLSEFLMVEQGGLQLYRVAAARSSDPLLTQRYEEFGRQTDQHRRVLVDLIEQLGGDPSYVSPTARLAQVKGAKLLEASMIVAGLSQQEIETNDLENLLLAETKDHADWSLLEQLAQQVDDPEVKQALARAVAEVESQEDEHLTWARETLSQLCLTMLLTGPALAPDRWMRFIAAPLPPITEVHPAPMQAEDGLEVRAQQPQWQETPVVRSVRGG